LVDLFFSLLLLNFYASIVFLFRLIHSPSCFSYFLLSESSVMYASISVD